MTTNLPIQAIVPQVIEKLRDNQCIEVAAPPGTGKSTLLPLEILHYFVADYSHNDKILMLEPRRLSARSIASRMSDMLGEKVSLDEGAARLTHAIPTIAQKMWSGKVQAQTFEDFQKVAKELKK